MWTRLELLKRCLNLQAESGKEKDQINPDLHEILEEIQDYLNCRFVIEEQENGNIYVTKGITEHYPCIISHTDQVARLNADKVVMECGDLMFAIDSTDGARIDTGGDDLCSVWACFQSLLDLPEVKVVFFVDEERGVHGSKAAKMEFFTNCKFVAQFDRNHNKSDFINFTNGKKVCSPEFETFLAPYLTKYDYAFSNGSITDVGALRINGLEISSFNISSGYFKPHSSNSYVIPSKLFTSYDLVMELFKDFVGQSVFPKEVYKLPTYSVGELYDEGVAKLLNDAYMKEHKSQKQHNVGGILRWVVKKLSTIDEKNIKIFPEYVEILDIVKDHFESKDECDFDTCKESKYMDYSDLGGPKKVCLTCLKSKEVENVFKTYHDTDDWGQFRGRF
jgi:hypothetical protein